MTVVNFYLSFLDTLVTSLFTGLLTIGGVFLVISCIAAIAASWYLNIVRHL